MGALTYLGQLSGSEELYLDKDTGQIIFIDTMAESEKTLTLEEYNNLCSMQELINKLNSRGKLND